MCSISHPTPQPTPISTPHPSPHPSPHPLLTSLSEDFCCPRLLWMTLEVLAQIQECSVLGYTLPPLPGTGPLPDTLHVDVRQLSADDPPPCPLLLQSFFPILTTEPLQTDSAHACEPGGPGGVQGGWASRWGSTGCGRWVYGQNSRPSVLSSLASTVWYVFKTCHMSKWPFATM